MVGFIQGELKRAFKNGLTSGIGAVVTVHIVAIERKVKTVFDSNYLNEA